MVPRHRLPIAIPEAYTIEEAAHRLGFRHRSTVYDLIQRGELVACQLGGGSLRVPADAIVEYLQRAVDGVRNGSAAELKERHGRRAVNRRSDGGRRTELA
jgi:excisionase family DNA binding protein